MDAWAVVEYARPLEKVQLPKHEPVGTEVVIAVTHCGVCHSDVHLWEGFYDLGAGRRLSFAQRGTKLPIAPGHEIAGVVIRRGPEAHTVKLGSPQIVYPWLGCGKCVPCSREQDNMCTAQTSLGVVRQGGFAAEVVVPHPRYLVDLGELDPAVACTYACSGMTALHAVRDLGPQHPDDCVVVIGTGGLGLAAIHVLRALGHKLIVAVDLSEMNRQAAVQAGAAAAYSSAEEGVQNLIRDAIHGARVTGVIDFVNVSATAALAFSIVDKGGRMAQVGLMGGELQLSLVGLIGKALTITGTNTGNLSHFREILSLAKSGKLVPPPIKTMPWDQAADAMTLLRDSKVTGRLVLVKE